MTTGQGYFAQYGSYSNSVIGGSIPAPICFGVQGPYVGGGTKIIPRAGTLNINMVQAPYQFSLNTQRNNPQFLTNNPVGNFWGIQGIYGTYPCYRVTNLGNGQTVSKLFQTGGFTLNESGIHNFTFFNDNPFGTGVATGGTNTLGYYASVGITGLFTASVSNNAGGGYELDYTPNFPSLSYVDITGNCASVQTNSSFGFQNLTVSSNGPILLIDELLREIPSTFCLYNPTGRNLQTINSTYPISSYFDYVNSDVYQIVPTLIQKEGVSRVIDTLNGGGGSIVQDFKVNPVTANFLGVGYGGNSNIAGTVLGRWDPFNGSGGTAHQSLKYFIELENSSDQSIFSSINWILTQIAGGGYFAVNYVYEGSAFLLTEDCSVYWRCNLNNFPNSGYHGSYCFAIDYAGILWAIDKTSNTLLWSGGPIIPEILQSITLPMLGNVCMNATKAPWLG